MIPKPKMFEPQYAAAFIHRSVVDTYHFRPPYPDGVIGTLVRLIGDGPRTVLDVGCGIGDIARQIVDHVDRVDAVDASHPMIEKGKSSPNGDNAKINWVHAPAETARLCPPYGLVVAGESIGWFDWERVFRRFKESLTAEGKLAIARRGWGLALGAREGAIFSRYSTNRDFSPVDVIEELELRGVFEKQGERKIGPVPWTFMVDEYIEARHSQQAFSRESMGRQQAGAFDDELRALWEDEIGTEQVDVQITAKVVWGRPL